MRSSLAKACNTVEPLKNRHVGMSHFVQYREVVLSSVVKSYYHYKQVLMIHRKMSFIWRLCVLCPLFLSTVCHFFLYRESDTVNTSSNAAYKTVKKTEETDTNAVYENVSKCPDYYENVTIKPSLIPSTSSSTMETRFVNTYKL